MTLCLTASEIREITGYTRHAQQFRALAAMGIRATRQPQSGRPLVDREDWRRYARKPERADVAPNWKAMQVA